jgi:multiple sugar transport system ATP-binding protein
VRPGLVALTATVDVLESTGSDVYAHLSFNGHQHAAEEPLLRELAQATTSEDPEAGLATSQSELVARVGVATSLAEGEQGRLWIDARRIHLFEPATGQRLSG